MALLWPLWFAVCLAEGQTLVAPAELMLLRLFLRLLHRHGVAAAHRHGLGSQRGATSRHVNWIGAGRSREQASLVGCSPEARDGEAQWKLLFSGKPGSAGQCHGAMADQGVVVGALVVGGFALRMLHPEFHCLDMRWTTCQIQCQCRARCFEAKLKFNGGSF